MATLVDPPRSVSKQVAPLTVEQAHQYSAFTTDDRLDPLFHVAIASGLRPGELFGLRWPDVSLDVGTVTGSIATLSREPMIFRRGESTTGRLITNRSLIGW
ncbi:MAG: hypothetical protein M3354_08485 [Chloroflexota bacterium]|nr:hypothetical protein [Chloroflexota bacterium]